ncbi:MAG: hypothetical protein IPK26_20815 [Planctomycetes bacterium]|nr:hypothetical protein [Planctomycetota bacterium]
MPMLSALTAFLGIAATIVAQKMPAAGDADRVVASWQLVEHLDRCQERAGSQLRGLPAPPGAVRAQCRQELLVAIRTFVEPALGPGDKVTLLGPDRLVALVRQDQVAWIDRFFARLGKTDLAARLDGQFDRITMPAAKAAEILAKPELPGTLALPVTKEQVLALRRSGQKTGGPTSWRFPHATWMIFGSGMPFVKNWRRVPLRGRDDDLVVPEIGEIHDGVEFELQYVPMPDDRIGWVMSAKVAIVDWDSPTRSVRIGEQDFVIDEPAVHAGTLRAALSMDRPAPFLFGQRLGDDVMLLVFTPR